MKREFGKQDLQTGTEALAERKTARSAFLSPGLLALIAGLAVLTAAGLLGLDRSTAEAVGKHEPAWLHAASVAFSRIGEVGLYPLAAVVWLIWGWRFRPNRRIRCACIWLLTSEAVCSLVTRALKIGFGRWRPGQALAGQFEFFKLSAKCNSFPSGHTADAAVVATVLWFVYPRLRPIYVAWVLLMAASRVGAIMHFVSDAAAGAAVGILCALVLRRHFDASMRGEDKMMAPGSG